MGKIIAFVTVFAIVSVCRGAAATDDSIVWDVNNLESIGGHSVTVIGRPKVIETEKGRAVQFDGRKDGLTLQTIPLAGMAEFTIEVIFRPDFNAPATAQRFLHIQQDNSKNRVLLLMEMLPPQNTEWYLDTYIRSDKGSQNLYKPAIAHTTGKWYNATLVCDGLQMRHYLNGAREAVGKLEFSPFGSIGKTSIGMKLDKTSWFKGTVRKIRFTSRALEPKEFLEP
jgi:hypothetical protein